METYTSALHPDVYEEISDELQKISHPLKDTGDLDPLMERIGDSRIVMLGEASHGTHEYYTWRSRITRRLIEEKGFNFIGVEADWPDSYRLNRFIKNYPESGSSSKDVLAEFNRWPTWMWANWEIVALSDWLRGYNQHRDANHRVGFYGLDVYSLWESIDAIINYLYKADPAAVDAAREALRCFEPYSDDEGQSYAYATRLSPVSCENEVVQLLKDIRTKLPLYNSDPEAVFSAEQNAIIAVNAEQYYRTMVQSGPESWNLRDSHMMETLNRLLDFHGPDSKAIVWEHNTHIGDARATDMAGNGMVNIGQLAREKYGKKDVISVGFGSYTGSVIAGRNWGAPMKEMKLPEAKNGSWENLLHEELGDDNLIMLDHAETHGLLDNWFGHRAVGVVYNPESEVYGNYMPSKLPSRYDAFIYLEETTALHPIRLTPDKMQVPETFPFGL